ncbi:MAG: sporulation integral membrane protein YlbJ [Peptococcaceae bacterium]|nr:sporulation integral membrane protein YlbJ [Peptococcaceae bacterium]
MHAKQFRPVLQTAVITLAVVVMIVFPQEVVTAAREGFALWAHYVLPALLPFFIFAELLMGTGFVHLLGVLLEPVMRPVFRLPGSAAFVVVMGYTSGPPIGAVLTAKLYRENLLTPVEAERLLTFTTNTSPGFMLGAVAAGMFGNPGLGLLLAAVNYSANLLLGIGMRFYGRGEPESAAPKASGQRLLRTAFRAMLRAQQQDNRPFGQLMGDAVRNSISTILHVGGFIVLFAVLIRVGMVLGFVQLLTLGLGSILHLLRIDPALFPGLVDGLFEVTLGAKAITQTTAPVYQQILLVSALMAWGGVSVHAQVASFISGTPIRLFPFVLGRFVHALLAVGIMTLITASHLPTAFTPVSQPLWQTQALALLLATISTGLVLMTLQLIYKVITNVLQRCLSPR